MDSTFVNRVGVRVGWVIKEKHDGLWVPVLFTHNLLTNFGLTAYAAAPSGQYVPPIYLVIDTAKAAMYTNSLVNDTQVQLTANPTIGGDTQIVLSVGLGTQETATFSSITGVAAPFIANLTAPLVNAHANSDPVVRAVTAGDTISSVLSEAQYDPVFNPNNRLALTASFSPGFGQNTMQFFISGLTATNLFFSHVGLADQQQIGSLGSNLHNYASFGYNHNTTADVEIDVTYTLQIF